MDPVFEKMSFPATRGISLTGTPVSFSQISLLRRHPHLFRYYIYNLIVISRLRQGAISLPSCPQPNLILDPTFVPFPSSSLLSFLRNNLLQLSCAVLKNIMTFEMTFELSSLLVLDHTDNPSPSSATSPLNLDPGASSISSPSSPRQP